ncbi:MAG: leucine-rich repeat domain-containing protein, partial [Clostridia bacterium]|nr:leucine-rich repeat domain-containing protein [Clostridia bacterium]
MKKIGLILLSVAFILSTVGLIGCSPLLGKDGLSAYELYLKYHPEYTKTEEEFIEDLVNGGSGAAIDDNPQGLEFCLKDDGTYGVSVGSAKNLSNVVIPSKYKGKAVTEINDSAFEGNKKLTSVTIPDSVTTIGYN